MKIFSALCLPLLLLACGKIQPLQLQDDWPGVDEIQIKKSPGARSLGVQEFDLQSQLLLPHMGKDISYSITSTCYRKKLENQKPQIKFYKKVSQFFVKNSTQDQNFHYLQDLLPLEVLIYPEEKFFTHCDFKLKANNQYQSQDKSELLEYKLVLTEENLKESQSLPFKAQATDQVFSLDDFIQITFKNNFASFPLLEANLVCHSNVVSISQLKLNSLEEFSFKKIKFSDFKFGPEQALNYCIIKGKNNQGQPYTSSRFIVDARSKKEKSLNIESLDDFKKSFFYRGQKDFSYNSRTFPTNINLYTFKVSSTSSRPRYFSFEQDLTFEDSLFVSTGLRMIQKDPIDSQNIIYRQFIDPQPKAFVYSLEHYAVELIPLSTRAEWSILDEDMNPKKASFFKILPGESLEIHYQVQNNFACSRFNKKQQLRPTPEHGFLFNPSRKSLLFKEVSTNDFITTEFNSSSFFEKASLKKQDLVTDNFSLSYTGSKDLKNSGVRLFFSNEDHILFGEDLIFEFQQMYNPKDLSPESRKAYEDLSGLNLDYEISYPLKRQLLSPETSFECRVQN